jgi:signal transduction histidine kinase
MFRIDIVDKGIGIPEHEKGKIFRRFFRAENALSYGEGTGLGLHIVKKYVELLDGQIRFESYENEGTTFYLTFPVVHE